MFVSILNKEELKNLYSTWGKFACTCYNTPEKYAEKVGKSCQSTGHYSGSRTTYIIFKISGIDRGTAEQLLRSEIGVRDYTQYESHTKISSDEVIKNMRSFRYVDMHDFDYITPDIIAKNENAKYIYDDAIDYLKCAMEEIMGALGDNSKQSLEATQFLLPRATTTELVIGFTIEALMTYMHKRLCVRTQPEHIKLAKRMKEVVEEILPEYAEYLVPHCEHLLYCPEGNMSCGRYKTKEKTIEILKLGHKELRRNETW